MINHELEVPEQTLDNPIANRELCLGQPPFDSSAPRAFVPGEHVRVVCGVFAGAEGIALECRQSSRWLLAVDAHQQGITLEIDGSALESIDGNFPRAALEHAASDRPA